MERSLVEPLQHRGDVLWPRPQPDEAHHILDVAGVSRAIFTRRAAEVLDTAHPEQAVRFLLAEEIQKLLVISRSAMAMAPFLY